MDNNTYINILSDTLVKKNTVMDKLIEVTLKQEEYINSTSLDMDKFNETLADKERLIEQLNQLDMGFEKIYDHVSEEIRNNTLQHKDQIIFLQNLIKQVTEKSARLQAIEIRNKGKLEIYFSGRKKEIKNFKRSSQTATSYYKNMTSQYQGESYFLDKKK